MSREERLEKLRQEIMSLTDEEAAILLSLIKENRLKSKEVVS